MTTGSIELLNLACGALLLTAVLILWRRETAAMIRIYAVQSCALAGVVAVLAADRGSAELWVMALAIVALRAVILPRLLRRVLGDAGTGIRESRPVVNVAASLVIAAVLVLLAYAVGQPIQQLAPSPLTSAVPIGIAVVLIGFFLLATRRQALSQVIGFLLMDNGITAVGFLTTAGSGVIVEAGVALDVLLVVLVLQLLATRITETFGAGDLDELRELRD